ncbi:hypothetical protein B0T22DRAFT_480203 [Podospora appendiculata]|uniref:Uncharacterized protein n=1 Tax=Podospora appendiculata TaxID=314037 RepID=A0AAE1CCS5_9PEZI|nr:hypothetical protein B0T22DRAFT_480203 [Podospora appendiculata]
MAWDLSPINRDDYPTDSKYRAAKRQKEGAMIVISICAILYFAIAVAALGVTFCSPQKRPAAERRPRLRADGCVWALFNLACFLLCVAWPAWIALGLLCLVFSPSSRMALGSGWHSLCLAPGQTCCGIRWNRGAAVPADEEAAMGAQGVVNGQPSSPPSPTRGDDSAEWEEIELPKYTPVTPRTSYSQVHGR